MTGPFLNSTQNLGRWFLISITANKPVQSLLLGGKWVSFSQSVQLGTYNRYTCLLPTGSEEKGVLGVGSIPVALSTSGCSDR